MAITINTNNDNYKHDELPATQGNVLNTLKSYNDELKKKYYDKEQVRADENALQISIQNIVSLLEKNTAFIDKTLAPNTTSEDTADNRLSSYNDNFDKDNGKSYNDAGLVQKINILAQLVSGKNDGIGWSADIHGNNVGSDESSLSVPVIGITRSNADYRAEIKPGSDSSNVLEITGLNSIEKDGKTEDISNKTVISEKQVADMISSSVISVLGTYDKQIAVMIAYLLFTEGSLPKSYEYVLEHTKQDGIQKAPLYITYDDEDNQSPRYYVHDLNGELKVDINSNEVEETPDYYISDSSLSTENENWKISIDINNPESAEVERYDGLNSNWKAEYSIDVPMKTLTLNVGRFEGETLGGFTYAYKLFGASSKNNDIIFSDKGEAFINVPQGSILTVNIPEEFKDIDFLSKYSYTDYEDNSVTLTGSNHTSFEIKMVNNQTVYTKNIKYILDTANGNGNTVGYSRYKSSSPNVILGISGVTKTGYKHNNTALGGITSDGNVTLDLNEKNFYQGLPYEEIHDQLIWEEKSVKIEYKYSDSGDVIHEVTIKVNGIIPDLEPQDGYTFDGLYEDINYNNKLERCPETDDEIITIYVKQTQIEYKNTFILNGGGFVNAGDNKEYHTFYGENVNLPKIEKAGYTFNGWYEDPNCTTSIAFFKNSDFTYYAGWTENTYTINFNLGNIENDSDAKPYFKYKSIQVKTSNLPITLGEAVATGYDFAGWKLDGAKKDTVNLEDFSNVNITLTASWTGQTGVTVLEEIYYQIDGSESKYDLAEVIKGTGTVGTVYTCSEFSTPNGGFEEKSPVNGYIVKASNNVVQRYFNRRTYDVSYNEGKKNNETDSSNLLSTYRYSDNDIELVDANSIEEGYTFDCWIGNDNRQYKKIPAYSHSDLSFIARYNQAEPVEGKDFSIDISTESITINNLQPGSTKALMVFFNGIDSQIDEKIESKKSFSFSEVYDNATSNPPTKYCYLRFANENIKDKTGENDIKIVNDSKQVEIQLKFNSESPIENTDFQRNTSEKTIRKIGSDDLEYKRSNEFVYSTFTQDITVTDGVQIDIRKAENNVRLASTSVQVGFDSLAPVSDNETSKLSNTELIKVTEGVSYNSQGEITIKQELFSGDHGPLQYSYGTGNSWLDVNKSESGDTILYIDKPCTVYFRYGKNNEFYATDSCAWTVGIKKHTVTFKVSAYKTKGGGYTGFELNDDGDFTVEVDSGSQLCKCPGYIDNVDNWKIYGYNKGVSGSSADRAVSFLKKLDGKNFNEATVITEDISLKMDFTPYELSTTYNTVLLDGIKDFNLNPTGETNGKVNFDYGSEFVIRTYPANGFGDILSDKGSFLDELENFEEKSNTDYTDEYDTITHEVYFGYNISFNGLWYKDTFDNDGTWGNTNVAKEIIEANDNKYVYNFEKGETPNIRVLSSNENGDFKYIFATCFEKTQETNTDRYFCHFDFNTGNISEIKVYNSTVGVSDVASLHLKYKITENNGKVELHFCHEDDPRFGDWAKLSSNSLNLGNVAQVDVVFHSALIDNVFYPSYKITDVLAKKITVTDDDINRIVMIEKDTVNITDINWDIEEE